MPKFYGDQEIIEIKNHPKLDTHQVLVLKNGIEKPISKKLLAVAVTEKPVDLTELRNLRCFPVVAEMLKLWHDWDIHIDDVNFLNLRATMSINEGIKKANAIVWGVDEANQAMSDVHAALMKDDKSVVSPFVEKPKA